ncbi:MAG: hypothetical protein IT425_03450 [Pirellulales bacterium]|nr:hypothetical protein [Pirellulales bacterium]
MLLPRFSIRTLFLLLSFVAIVSIIVGTAVRGEYWAWGVSIALLSLLLVALVHAALFAIMWVFTRLPNRSDPPPNPASKP